MQVHIDLVPPPTGPLAALGTDDSVMAALNVRVSSINKKKLEQAHVGQRVQVWWKEGTKEIKYKAQIHKVTRPEKGSKDAGVHVVWEDNKGRITEDEPYPIPFRHLWCQLLLPGDDGYDDETGVYVGSACMHVYSRNAKTESVYACAAPQRQEHSASAGIKTTNTNPAPEVLILQKFVFVQNALS